MKIDITKEELTSIITCITFLLLENADIELIKLRDKLESQL